jgi:hypothetical protein
MRIWMQRFITGILIAGTMAPCPLDAQTRSNDAFATGAPLREVLAAWGEPDERIERSVKRELVWNYKGGAHVVFKDGRVTSFKVARADAHAQAKKAAAAESAKKSVSISTESKDFLRDIVREIPSGADGPAPLDPSSSNDPSVAGLIPNAVPQRSGQPAIAPGVVVPSLEEDQ